MGHKPLTKEGEEFHDNVPPWAAVYAPLGSTNEDQSVVTFPLKMVLVLHQPRGKTWTDDVTHAPTNRVDFEHFLPSIALDRIIRTSLFYSHGGVLFAALVGASLLSVEGTSSDKKKEMTSIYNGQRPVSKMPPQVFEISLFFVVEKRVEGNNSSGTFYVTFLVYFITMASQTGCEIMDSEVAGSILTVFAVKKKRKKKGFSHVQEPVQLNHLKTTMRAIRLLLQVIPITKGRIGY